MLSVRRNNLQYQRSCDWPPGGQTLGKAQVLEMGIDTPVDCDVCPTEHQRKKYRHGLQDQRCFPVDHVRMFSSQFTFLTKHNSQMSVSFNTIYVQKQKRGHHLNQSGGATSPRHLSRP